MMEFTPQTVFLASVALNLTAIVLVLTLRFLSRIARAIAAWRRRRVSALPAAAAARAGADRSPGKSPRSRSEERLLADLEKWKRLHSGPDRVEA